MKVFKNKLLAVESIFSFFYIQTLRRLEENASCCKLIYRNWKFKDTAPTHASTSHVCFILHSIRKLHAQAGGGGENVVYS